MRSQVLHWAAQIVVFEQLCCVVLCCVVLCCVVLCLCCVEPAIHSFTLQMLQETLHFIKFQVQQAGEQAIGFGSGKGRGVARGGGRGGV